MSGNSQSTDKLPCEPDWGALADEYDDASLAGLDMKYQVNLFDIDNQPAIVLCKVEQDGSIKYDHKPGKVELIGSAEQPDFVDAVKLDALAKSLYTTKQKLISKVNPDVRLSNELAYKTVKSSEGYVLGSHDLVCLSEFGARVKKGDNAVFEMWGMANTDEKVISELELQGVSPSINFITGTSDQRHSQHGSDVYWRHDVAYMLGILGSDPSIGLMEPFSIKKLTIMIRYAKKKHSEMKKTVGCVPLSEITDVIKFTSKSLWAALHSCLLCLGMSDVDDCGDHYCVTVKRDRVFGRGQVVLPINAARIVLFPKKHDGDVRKLPLDKYPAGMVIHHVENSVHEHPHVNLLPITTSDYCDAPAGCPSKSFSTSFAIFMADEALTRTCWLARMMRMCKVNDKNFEDSIESVRGAEVTSPLEMTWANYFYSYYIALSVVPRFSPRTMRFIDGMCLGASNRYIRFRVWLCLGLIMRLHFEDCPIFEQVKLSPNALNKLNMILREPMTRAFYAKFVSEEAPFLPSFGYVGGGDRRIVTPRVTK